MQCCQYSDNYIISLEMPRLDSENIFPKRLGVMNGNQIILEYYNFTIDKFKKHAIPFDTQQQSKHIIEQIYKDPKHIPYLKKVDPKTLKSVIQGHTIPTKKQSPLRQKQTNFKQFYEQPIKPNTYSRSIIKEPSYEQQISEVKQPQNKVQIKQSHKEQIDQYYGEQFQSFQISQSFDKKTPVINSFSNTDKSKTSQNKSSVSKSQKDSSSDKSKTVQKVEQPISKKGKKGVVIQEVIKQEYEDDFQFIDEIAEKDKKKKEKKQKKQKSKSKKQKKSKKEKDSQKSSKPQATQIQEQFQFL